MTIDFAKLPKLLNGGRTEWQRMRLRRSFRIATSTNIHIGGHFPPTERL